MSEQLDALDALALEVIKRAARGGAEKRTVTTTTRTDADGNVISTTTKESVKTLPPDEDAARWLRERGIEF